MPLSILNARGMPKKIKLVVTDFDGVLTDGRVWIDENGRETVAATRSDSMRIKQLREHGIEVMILSSEVNPVVSARAKKMNINAIHGMGLNEKGDALKKFLDEKNIDASQVVYLGNDFNDLPCYEIAGWSVANRTRPLPASCTRTEAGSSPAAATDT